MIITHNRYKGLLGVLASIFLGITFVVAGSSKVFTPIVEAELLEVLWIILMSVEIAVGLFLVACIFPKPMASFSLLLIAGFVASNFIAIALGYEECLSCFGAMGKLSIGQALFLDVVMIGLAVTILLWYPSRFFNKRPWYW